MWIRIPDDKAGEIFGALFLHDPKLVDQIKAGAPRDGEELELNRKYLNAARTIYGSTELEFDNDAVISKGDDPGAFVMGWRWVTDAEADVPSNEEE